MQHAMLLQQGGFTFMFAQNHHPAMKHIVPIRKSIPHRTIFNILGPLTNPAKVKKQLVGVFDKSYISPVINALKIGGTKSAIVVSSNDGLDEVSISDVSFYSQLKNNQVTEHELDIEKYGFKKANFDAIKGGDVNLNAEILRNILSGEIQDSRRDIVILNTALGLVADEKARDIQDGIEIAKDSIDSQKAIKKLNFNISLSQKI
jgi:anthranilate phosphoribosyltransferase